MDSDDEATLGQLNEQIKNKDWHIHSRVLSGFLSYHDDDRVHPKLYQDDEWECLREEYYRCKYDDSVNEIDWRKDLSAVHRFRRFFDSIKGFHSGFLDLTGRHETRYRRLLARWNRFLADVLKISRHATKVEVPLGNGKSTIEYTIDCDELLEKFRKDWMAWGVDLSFVFTQTERLLEYLSEHPTPKFQKLRSHDLPPELIHSIMHAAGNADARRLGSTSKYFREISLPYTYVYLGFDLPLSSGVVSPESPETNREHFQMQVRAACEILSERLDYIISRPDMLKWFKHVIMFGWRYHHAKAQLGFEAGSQEYNDLFGSIESRVSLLLRRTSNLRTLALAHVPISNEIIEVLESSRKLRWISLFPSQMIIDTTTRLPLFPSVVNAGLTFASDETLSLWVILEAFPNLRFLQLHFSDDLTGIEPGVDIVARFNPFTSLKRIILERVDPFDIQFLAQWIQESPSLDLTHFWIEGGRYGIYPPDIELLLLALSPAPLQVLVLDGLHYVEPSLFDEIARVFPNLRALTLLYRQSERQTQTGVSTWPNASWEYAPHFRGFQQLEFFCWNFHVERMEMAFHQTLRHFEEGVPEEQWMLDDEEYLTDWNSVARVLAAYCPTLEYVAFHSGPQCTIRRTSSGGITVTGGDISTMFGPRLSEKYFPLFSSTWENAEYLDSR